MGLGATPCLHAQALPWHVAPLGAKVVPEGKLRPALLGERDQEGSDPPRTGQFLLRTVFIVKKGNTAVCFPHCIDTKKNHRDETVTGQTPDLLKMIPAVLLFLRNIEGSIFSLVFSACVVVGGGFCFCCLP